MNKKRTFSHVFAFLAIALAVIRPGSLQSETSNVDPRVLFPTGDASWTVTFEPKNSTGSKNSKASEVPEIQKIDVVSRGTMRRDTIHWSKGANGESWWIKNPPVTLIRNRPGEPVRLMKSSYLNSLRFDDSSFSWVNAETYKGEETRDGKKVRRYQQKRRNVPEDGDRTANRQTALIDVESGRPVLWSDETVTVIFSFDPAAPTAPLVMPEDFRDAIKKYLAYISPPRKLGKKQPNQQARDSGF